MQRLSFRRFDAVVAVSAPLEHQLRQSGLGDRVHLIPNAFDADAATTPRAVARHALGIQDGSFRVGWVGRLTPEKGADVLVDALLRLADDAITISIIGDGPDRPVLESKLASAGRQDRLIWHGRVPEAGRLVGGFDLFVLSSRTEGTPMVLFEAMAAGVPIVATAVGGVPDVLTEEDAWLVPSEDPAALAHAISVAKSMPDEAARRARSARRRLEQRFGLAPWLARYEALYRQVQHKRRTP